MRGSFGIVVTLLFVLPASVVAQISGGAIVGTVSDPSGAAIVKASVAAANTGTGVVNETVTSAGGRYEFPLLPAGRYMLTVKATGFETATSDEITLHAGTDMKFDFNMVVGQLSESVKVEATAPLVNSTNTELGVVIESGKIRELPLNGRDFTKLLSLQPGWNIGTYSGSRGGVEINGTPGLGNNWLMDGVDMSFGENNGVGIGAVGGSGTTINTISIEAIEEFKSTSGAFEAEYGHSTGGVVNLTTRSGTNQFHGTAWEFFRNDKLDANNFFSNAAGRPKPPLRFNQFGANLGGPIWPNRIFFFFNYEGAKVRRLRQITGNVPTPLMLSQVTNPILEADLAKLPTSCTPTSNPLLCFHSRDDQSRDDEYTTLSRLDGNFRNNHLSFRLAYNQQTVTNPQLRQDIRQYLPVPVKNFTISDTFNISPTILNEARFGYNHYPIARHLQSINPADNTTVPGCCTVTAQPRGIVAPGISFFTLDLLFADTPTSSFLDNFTWIRGAHTLKAGFEMRDVTGKRIQYGQGAREFYNSLDDLIHDKIYQLELDFGNPGTEEYKLWTYAGYVQDAWKISRRLQVNIGVRYEYYTQLKGPVGLAQRNPFGPLSPAGTQLWSSRPHNFAPRAGLVYDLFGDGKTVFRAGAAISYLPPQPFNYYDLAWLSYKDPGGNVVAVPAFPVVNVTDLPASVQPVSYPFPDAFLQLVRTDPSKAPPGLAAGRSVADPEGKDEHVEMWNASLQRQVARTLAVQVSYVGNRALNLYTTRPINYVDPATGSRPVPSIGPITYREDAGSSWYNALQISVDKRFGHGYQINGYYTWSKAMQYHGAETLGDNWSQDPNNFAASIGPNQGAVGQRVTIVHSYQIPNAALIQKSTLARAVLGGWTLDGIFSARAGDALNITLGTDVVGNGLGGTQRPDRVAGISQYLSTSNPLLWLNPAAYDAATPKAQKRFGNLGFNTAVGPGQFTWDLGIHKEFAIRESHRITFRFEMFNWMNHTIFSDPITTLSDPNFGRITGSSGERNIQLGLKYTF